MSNKSTFTAQLRIEAIVADAQKELTNFGNSLKNAWQGGEPPKSLMRTYEQMRVRLESLKQISEKGLVDTSDLRQAENDFKAFQKDIHNLTVEFKLMSTEQKRVMLSTEEQAVMKARTAAVKEYTDALKKNQDIVKQRKPLEQQRATIIEEQEPRRKQLQATLTDVGDRKLRLESRGPVYNKVAEQYLANIKKAKTYTTKIENLELKPALSKKDVEMLEAYKNALKEIDVITGKADQEEAYQRHKEEIEKAKSVIEATTKEMEEMDLTVRKLDEQLAKLNPVDETEQLNKLKERLKELGVEGIDDAKDIDTLRKAIQQLDDKAFAKVEQSLKDMNAGLNAMGAEALQVGKEIDTSTEAIERQNEALRNQEAFEGRIKQFLGMTGAVELLRRAMTSAFNTIKELDAAMTEMAVVTDIDISGYWDQLPEYTARANELGLTIKDVYEADTLFYQQGLETNEVIELSTQTMRMARVAGLDTAEATDRMTAALRGFNMELNETNAQKIADVYSELAAITASDVDEISSAMTKTASIAASAGMEFETTAAFLSQIIETTRESAETAGTALKTVIARFQELKKDPSEIGEVEGEIVDANKIETALRSVGVALRDSSGQFRDLDDVFLDLAKKWDGLDKNTQRYIATIAAGSRQQSRFIAMMSDYARTQELVSAATSSAGANQEQFEKTMDSIRTKLNKLKNAWEEFSMGILESDLVKAGVDILTTFLKVINKATSAFDGLGGSIMKIVTVIGMFNIAKKIFAKIKQPIFDTFSAIVIEAYKKGGEAAEAMHKGAKERVEKLNKEETGEPPSNKGEETPKEKRTFGQWAKDTSGITSFSEGARVIRANANKQKLAERGFDIDTAKKWQENRKGAIERGKSDSTLKPEDLQRLQKEYKKTEKSIKDYEEAQQYATENADEAWNQVGQGVSQVGNAVAGLGVGISLIGGLFSELGLEEVGEGFATVGNIVTMAGAAFSALGTIVPIVAKAMAAAGYTVQSAWWPLLVIGLALAAVAAIVAGIVSSVKAAEAAKLENRMKAAAEATQEAEKSARAAQEAYEALEESWSRYNEQADGLNALTEGTTEWKKALSEANQEVMNLVEEYPELLKYISRTKNGKLVISDEGWKAIESTASKQITNTLIQRMNAEKEETILAEESANKAWNDFISAGMGISVSLSTMDENNENSALRALDMLIYGEANRNYDFQVNRDKAVSGEEAAILMKDAIIKGIQSGVDKETIKQNMQTMAGEESMDNAMYTAFGSDEDAINGIIDYAFADYDKTLQLQLEKENEALTFLSQIATNTAQESDYSNEIFDFYAGYYTSDAYVDAFDSVKEQIQGDVGNNKTVKNKNATTDKLGDTAQALFTKYKIETSGNAVTDLQKLYTAMTGVTEFGDDLDTAGELSTAIAKIQQADNMAGSMEKLAVLMQGMDPSQAQNLAGLLGSQGAYYTLDLQKLLYDTTGDIQAKELTKEALEETFEQMGTSLETVAEAMGISADELVDQIEDNTKASYRVQAAAFKKFNEVTGKNITSFSEEVALGVNEAAGIANKLTDTYATYGVDLSEEFSAALDEVGPDQGEQFARYIQALNFADLSEMEGVQAELAAMGIKYGESVRVFIEAAMKAAHAVDIIDFSKLNTDLKNVYDTLQAFKEGELGRELDEKVYTQLITADSMLSTDFVQIGDKFMYIGTSIDKLIEALEKNTLAQVENAQYQYDQQLVISKALQDYAVEIGGSTYSLGSNFSLVGNDVKVNILDDIRNQLIKEVEAGRLDSDALKYLDENLDIDLTSDFTKFSPEKVDAALAAFAKIQGEIVDLEQNDAKSLRESQILYYSQGSSAETNAVAVRDASLSETERANRMEALKIQAIQSGNVAENVISAYTQAIKNNNTDDINKYERAILNGINNAVKNQAAMQKILDLQMQVEEALYNERQIEIDKLSQINDSINSANQELVNKIQEQIDDARQARENERTEQEISDLESQRAYLMAAGGSAVEIASLDKQIAESKESYQDSLIDQAMANIQDANERAAEQREQQISLAQQQLDLDKENGALARQAERIVNESLQKISEGVDPETTKLGEAIASRDGWGSMTTEERELALDNFSKTAVAAANAYDLLSKGPGSSEDEEDGTGDSPGATGVGAAANIRGAIKDYTEQKADAVNAGLNAILGQTAGVEEGKKTQGYIDAKTDYVNAGGLASEFDQKVAEANIKEYRNRAVLGETGQWMWREGGQEEGKIKQNDQWVWYKYDRNAKPEVSQDTLNNLFPGAENQQVAVYQQKAYIKANEGWREITQNHDQIRDFLLSYKTGGVADFTGPAWLDGTKARPELILNQRDTQNFIALKDILSDVMKNNVGPSQPSSSSGDNYFDIEINVESLENDYDVEQIADKIRDMIYRDATYRNVNTVNQKK